MYTTRDDLHDRHVDDPQVIIRLVILDLDSVALVARHARDKGYVPRPSFLRE